MQWQESWGLPEQENIEKSASAIYCHRFDCTKNVNKSEVLTLTEAFKIFGKITGCLIHCDSNKMEILMNSVRFCLHDSSNITDSSLKSRMEIIQCHFVACQGFCYTMEVRVIMGFIRVQICEVMFSWIS